MLRLESCHFKDSHYGGIHFFLVSLPTITKVATLIECTFNNCQAIGVNSRGAIHGIFTNYLITNCDFINCATNYYGGAFATKMSNNIYNKMPAWWIIINSLIWCQIWTKIFKTRKSSTWWCDSFRIMCFHKLSLLHWWI